MSHEWSNLLNAPSNLDDEHSEFYCPITCELMVDPVICSDGTSYERAAIETWLISNNTSPLTRMILQDKKVVPNLSLRALVSAYRERHGERVPRLERNIQNTSQAHVLPTSTGGPNVSIPPVYQMPEQQARRHLQRHVNSGWTTDSSAVASCNINSCITVCTIVTTISTFIETRKIRQETVAYIPDQISPTRNGIAPSPWDMECVPPLFFRDDEQKKEIPFTSHIETCIQCNGLGVTDCSGCRGSLQQSCPLCTKGKRSSNTSNICIKCHGSKNVPCENVACDAGKITCPKCMGSRKVRQYKSMVRKLSTVTHFKCTGTLISETDLSTVTLSHATGISVYTDQAYRVTPPTDFTGEISLNLIHVKEKSDNSVTEAIREGAKVLQQKISIQQVPITMTKAEYSGTNFHWYVYGTGNTVLTFNYPNKCCEWCNRCSIS